MTYTTPALGSGGTGVGVTTWTYDVRGRVVTEARDYGEGLGAYTLQTQYDAANRVATVEYPTGEVVSNSRDLRGLVKSVIGRVYGGAWVYLIGASYDALGRATELPLGSGVTTHTTYREDNFLLARIRTENQGGDVLDLGYRYDPVGNVAALTDTVRGEVSSFAYDGLDRLVGASGPLVEQFTYDATGDIEVGTGVEYGYLAAGHVHAVTHLDNQERYRYDANGNMVYRVSGGVTYEQEFDIENRLSVVTDTVGGVVTTIAYDGDGARIWQTNGVTTCVYVGDVMEVTLAPSHHVTRTYCYAGGQRIGARVAEPAPGGAGEVAQLYYLHADHLGSTVLATYGQLSPLLERVWLPLVMREYDASVGGEPGGGQPPLGGMGTFASPAEPPEPGEALEGSETRYTAYGEVRTDGPAVGGLTEFTYTGQQVHRDTGLMYYDARWYDAALGRFISPDPIVPDPADPQSLNRYSYVGNNPCRYADPSGYCGADLIQGPSAAAYGLYQQCLQTQSALEESYGVDIGGVWMLAEMTILEAAFGDLDKGLGGDEYTRHLMQGTEIRRQQVWVNERGGGADTEETGAYINVYHAAFSRGENAARYTLLHETYHVFDPGLFPKTGYSHQRATGGFWREDDYIPAGRVFSQYASDSPREDAAESWAGYLFGGDWVDLIVSDRQVFRRMEPTPVLPASFRVFWARQMVAHTRSEVHIRNAVALGIFVPTQ